MPVPSSSSPSTAAASARRQEWQRSSGSCTRFPDSVDGQPDAVVGMLGVAEPYRVRVGRLLKIEQRRRRSRWGSIRSSGPDDPLQALNAHLNFVKLARGGGLRGERGTVSPAACGIAALRPTASSHGGGWDNPVERRLETETVAVVPRGRRPRRNPFNESRPRAASGPNRIDGSFALIPQLVTIPVGSRRCRRGRSSAPGLAGATRAIFYGLLCRGTARSTAS